MINSFYKKIGKYFINKKNVLFLLSVISFLTFFVGFNILNKFIKLRTNQNKLNHLEFLSINTLEQRKEIKNFIDRHTSYDKFFIDKNLENLTFLENEKKMLCKLIGHPAFSNNYQIKKRLEFIEKGTNKLKFAEENIKQTSLIKETDENQLYPIEIDEHDLQKILSIIESPQICINTPQLIIKNFLLNKEKEKNFSLDMKILKREYFKKKNDE